MLVSGMKNFKDTFQELSTIICSEKFQKMLDYYDYEVLKISYELTQDLTGENLYNNELHIVFCTSTENELGQEIINFVSVVTEGNEYKYKGWLANDDAEDSITVSNYSHPNPEGIIYMVNNCMNDIKILDRGNIW